MKYIFRNSLTLLLIYYSAGTFLQAQSTQLEDGIMQHKVQLSFTGGKPDSVSYLEVRDSAAFQTLAELIDARHFPLCVVKKPVVGPFISLVQNYESQLDQYKLLEQHYKTLDTIQNDKLKQMEQLVALQKDRAENYRQLADDLTGTNKELSTQLDQALKTAKDCNNTKVKKQWRMAILGGAVGFSVASLIALIN